MHACSSGNEWIVECLLSSNASIHLLDVVSEYLAIPPREYAG
jgi:hypothetical protein